VPTLRWTGESLRIIDQRKLPGRTVYIDCRDVGSLAEAIRTLAVRGAPAIGLAAAYGTVISALHHRGSSSFRDLVASDIEVLASTRPTAVNLFIALSRQRSILEASPDGGEAARRLLSSADSMLEEDLAASRAMGALGADLLGSRCSILTHCNAGGLATGGLGTALAVLYEAHRRGLLEMAYADETRPLLQGSRLTAWELRRAGIPVTVLPDSAAASLLSSGAVAAVFTGADRIACNGDTANKIGTYPLALAARAAGVPFYIVAPLTTFDPRRPDGSSIPVEQRDAGEVLRCGSSAVAARGSGVFNPAFDVTPNHLISAIVCEKAVIRAPFHEEIRLLTAGMACATFLSNAPGEQREGLCE
jgi:methylthioribose-1-phosphate isomerase